MTKNINFDLGIIESLKNFFICITRNFIWEIEWIIRASGFICIQWLSFKALKKNKQTDNSIL